MAVIAQVGGAVPASAQTAPTPAPNPLDSLIPNLLAPLQPLLNPAPAPTVPGVVIPGATNGASGSGGNGRGGGVPSPPIPQQVEVHCGGVPRPLVFARTPGRTTKPLLDAAAKLTPPGGSVAQTVVRIAAPFPVAGSAAYRDDWGEPRSTPCPHLHQGNDIFANFGTPFVAPEAATVERYGFEGVGGNSVYLMGDDGYGFYGAHLEGFAPDLKVGQHVAAGTELGFVGNTGDAAGGSPHLHFQLYAPGHAWGTPEDPKFWLDNALNQAISNAGGVVPLDGEFGILPPAPQGVNVGSLIGSVFVAGGHIVSQPTVPVLLFVILVLGTIGVAQTRTFKVAAELRRSRSSITVPGFIVGGVPGLVRQPAPSRRERRQATWAGLPDAGPAWSRVGATDALQAKPSLTTRMVAAMGDAWGRFPERMSRVSSSKSKFVPFEPPASMTSNGNGHPDGNGHSNRNGNGTGRSWVPASPAGAGRKARDNPGGWTPPGSNPRR